mgnify:CR=1 FL=1
MIKRSKDKMIECLFMFCSIVSLMRTRNRLFTFVCVCVWADIERHLFDLNITRRRDEFHKEDFYGKKSGRFFRFLVLVGVIAIIVLKFMDI